MSDTDLLSARSLSKIPLLRSFSFAELAELRGATEIQRRTPGSALLREGQDGGRDFFILMEGTVEIRIGETLMATREPFAIFGEIAFVGHHKRTASVVTKTDCVVLRVSSRRVEEMVTRNPMVAWKLMEAIARLICDRYMELDGKIRGLMAQAPPEIREGYEKVQAEIGLASDLE